MALIVAGAILVIGAVVGYHLIDRIPQLLQALGSADRGDPRIAAAAMMYVVATEHGPLTTDGERHIEELMCSKMAIDPAAARGFLTHGRRIADRVHGDLVSRLDQLVGPVEDHCSREEKQDLLDMLMSIGRYRDEPPASDR